MNFLIDLLHLVAAAALSLIGFGYERDQDCTPVQLQPAAIVETVELEPSPAGDAHVETVADCEADARPVRLPTL